MNNNTLGEIFEFKCKPEAEIYFNEDSMWGCYSFSTQTPLPNSRKEKYGNPFNVDSEEETSYISTLVGNTQRLNIGQEYDVRAKFLYNKKYRQYQYEIISVAVDLPKTEGEQKKFLQAILTDRQAEILTKEYPNIVDEVMSGTDKVDLSKLNGIGEITWDKIKEKIVENYVLSDILSLLSPLGITISKIKRLVDNESNPMVLKERILNNPYVLSDINGVGFKNADKIAIGLNPELEVSNERLSAFISDYLKNAGNDDGHTWVFVSKLEEEINDNIPACSHLFSSLIEKENENRTFLYVEDDKVGLLRYRYSETTIWDIINKLNTNKPLDVKDEELERGIRTAEENQGFSFTDEQRYILKSITKNNFNLITGKAGTGKTTLLRGTIAIYQEAGYSIGTCALSAKASKRIEEATGHFSMTIHRLLGAIGLNEFEYGQHNRLPYDVIILDEASMVNASIMRYLLLAVRDNAKVVFCGDAKQLPPIGYGNVFADLLEKDNILQVNSLTKILRQAEASGIITDANKIREGVDPLGKIERKIVHGELNDMHYQFRDNRESLNKIAIEAFMLSVDRVGIDNVFILTPRKDNCLNSTKEINNKIQGLLFNNNVPSLTYGDKEFMLGCKVIHRVNNYDKNIFNGEIGYVKYVYQEELVVDYGDKQISYLRNELKELEHAYALTTHLYQGSEAHTVIGIIDNSHFMLLDTTFLYTMITRASKRFLLLAEPYAYKKCLKNNKSISRQTWIKEMTYG